MSNKLEDFLWSEVLKANPKWGEVYCTQQYLEDVNPDALSEDWLEKGTSWKWKVGVYALIDANKCDWAQVFIGMQRDKGSPSVLVGALSFPDGENDDMGRVIQRALSVLKEIHPAFND